MPPATPMHPFAMDDYTARKRRELIAILMDNVFDLQMLYQLVATCSTAKDMYEKWPVHYLKTSLSGFPKDLQKVVIANIMATKDPRGLLLDRFPDDGQQCQDDSSSAGMDSMTGEAQLHCSQHQSWYTLFLEKYMSDHLAELPTPLPNPLWLLKNVSLTYQSIENLVNADVWHSALAHDDPASPIPDREAIRRALWHLQLFSVIWEPPSTQNFQTRAHTQPAYDQSQHHFHCDQHRFFHSIGYENTVQLVKVYDDLLVMLHHVYAADVALIFEAQLKEKNVRMKYLVRKKPVDPNGIDRYWDRFSRSQLVNDCDTELNGYFHHRMSLGTLYLSEVNRTRSSLILPIDRSAKSENWTNQFFLNAAFFHRCDGFEKLRRLAMNHGGSYVLRPVEDPKPPVVRRRAIKAIENGIGKLLRASKSPDTRLGFRLEIVLCGHLSLRERHLVIEQPILKGESVHPIYRGVPEESVHDHMIAWL